MSWPSRSKDEFVPLSSFVSCVHEGRYVYTLLRLRLSSTGEKCASPSSFVIWGHVVSVPPSPESAGDEDAPVVSFAIQYFGFTKVQRYALYSLQALEPRFIILTKGRSEGLNGPGHSFARRLAPLQSTQHANVLLGFSFTPYRPLVPPPTLFSLLPIRCKFKFRRDCQMFFNALPEMFKLKRLPESEWEV